MAESRICAADGCNKTVKIKGFCLTHYKAQWANSQTEMCAADGCDKRARGGRAYCSMHQARLDRNGSLDKIRTRRRCAAEGCDKPNFGHGYCSTHYARWMRNGDAEKLQERIHKGLTFITEVALKWDSDECLLWPYAKANYGYGEIWIDGRKRLTHRIVCEMAYGKAPADKNDAAHSCGNRLCVNPGHLRWATRTENNADKLIHGTSNRGERHGRVKLTADDVRAIRALKGKMRHKDIARKFNISPKYVSDLVNRRGNWFWLE